MRLLKSKSLIFDVYGAYVRDLGGWISIAHLVMLLDELGTDENLVRSAVSRFTSKGLLARRKVDGQIGYELTDRARRILAEGDDRIFKRLEPADASEGWVLVTFSVPEEIRAVRHQLRSRLAWLGFGNVGSGLWIAPRRVMQRTIETVAELDLTGHVDLFEAQHRAFGDQESLVRRCWDIPSIARVYRDFIDDFTPALKQAREEQSENRRAYAFVDYTTALHEWRKLPYMDPGLPLQLLPQNWEGAGAADLFGELQSRLEPMARRHVVDVLTR